MNICELVHVEVELRARFDQRTVSFTAGCFVSYRTQMSRICGLLRGLTGTDQGESELMGIAYYYAFQNEPEGLTPVSCLAIICNNILAIDLDQHRVHQSLTLCTVHLASGSHFSVLSVLVRPSDMRS